jgi:polar amino acid transport system substrate-binding protein
VRQRRGAHWLAVLLLGLAAAAGFGAPAVASAPPRMLRIAANEANGPPFVLYDGHGHLVGGLARDVIDPFAAALEMRVEYLDLPRARVESWLAQDRIDGACFLAPAWVARPGALRWSPPLFRIRQVIVSPPAAAPVDSARALFGRRLGTLLNYHYPELQPYFADGRIHRSDAPSFASNIAKLERGRIDAFLNDDIASLYATRSGRLPADTRIDLLWAPENPVHCAFGPAFAAREPRWSAILQAHVDAGDIERAIATYTGGRRAVAGAPR